ncbi:MAG TPA: hypothetical protein VF148_03745 [Acidimicrobiia bacterium]
MLVAEPWVEVFHVDPRPWILSSEEAPERWVALAASAVEDEEVESARRRAVASPMVQELIARLAQRIPFPGNRRARKRMVAEEP